MLETVDLPEKVDGILAAPPCTAFANSGARWVRSDEEMLEGLSVVDACLRIIARLQPRWWALENPVGTLSRYLGPPRMTFHPYWYAGWAPEPDREAYAKRTSLWGNFNDELVRHEVNVTRNMILERGGRSLKTKNARSATPLGFARAFAMVNP